MTPESERPTPQDTDAGFELFDAGVPEFDAGVPEVDAGFPEFDAGFPEFDAGFPEFDAGFPEFDAGFPEVDAGFPEFDAGTPVFDAGTPVFDAGSPVFDAGSPVFDAGRPPDAGTPVTDAGAPGDGGTPKPWDGGPSGPWPTVTLKNYSQDYGFGRVQSVGVDDAQNIWLLDGFRIGVLRPGTTRVVWTSGVGQAGNGRASGSTVICGGAAGRAYVGYRTEHTSPYHESPSAPEYLYGDMDLVKLNADGTVSLETHLGKTTSTAGLDDIGIRNTNDWHYDEDQSVLVCTKVMRGRDRGEIYIGTNHGVTRIKGDVYNSHRHPVWDVNGSLRIGYNYAVGIAQNGDVLIGNEWKIGIVTPPAALADWDNHTVAPYKLNTHADEVSSLEDMDFWRGFEQTKSGEYFLGSSSRGVWKMTLGNSKSEADFVKLSGLPTNSINALAATDDGSLFIGTDGSGLWRLDASKSLARVSGISGNRVRQLVYDPTVSPAALYVVTDNGLTVLRGH